MKLAKISIAGVLASVMVSGQAALIDRGSGLIYDDGLNVTWLANANLAASNSFGVPAAPTSYASPGTIANGLMDWATANTWIAGMNAANYLGFSNWRLPTALYPDPSCDSVSGGHNCAGSEMGHLYYDELGGVANQDIATTHNSNYSLFQNIINNTYWTGTGFTLAPQTPNDNMWNFYFAGGVQSTKSVESYGPVFVVRTGDVTAPIPEPETYAMLLAGLGLLGCMAQRRKQKDAA